MALEDRFRSSVDAALDELRGRVDRDMRAMVDELVASAAEERDKAVSVARQVAIDEASEHARRQVAEVEARLRATADQDIAEAREREREQATAMRRRVEGEAEQTLKEALAAAEGTLKLALTDAEARGAQAIEQAVAAAHVREREVELAEVTRLLESVRGLDGAASLSEILDALGLAAGREAARAAVLVLRQERLLGWKLSGFGAYDNQPKTIDLGLTEGGVIGLAVGTARSVTTRDGHANAKGPEFAQLPRDRMGFAVPVIVGGRVVAVVYADSVTQDGHGQMVPSGWPEVIEILARHAARCLEALTVQKAAVPSPRFWVPPAGQVAPA